MDSGIVPDGYRPLPNNLEAEMGLLGAILSNTGAYDRVGDYLRPEHFFDVVHGKIFHACATLIQRGQTVNPTTLKQYFDSAEYDAIGGHAYLAELAGASFGFANAADYGDLILDLYKRRVLIDVGRDIVDNAYSDDPELDASMFLEQAERQLFEVSENGSAEGGFERFDIAVDGAVEMAQHAFESDADISGISTGFRSIDRRTGGLTDTDLIVLAGRPGIGKSSLALNIAEKVADQGYTVGFFSHEMSKEQLAARIIASRAELSSEKIRNGELNREEYDRLRQNAVPVRDLPIYVDDTADLTIHALRGRARRLKRRYGLDLVVVDYIQLLSGGGRNGSNRVQEISEITRGLKTLAKELSVPVLALSQLSRAVEQRDDKHPMLADLRDSGSIEQDADMVWFLYRHAYYLAKEEPQAKPNETKDTFRTRVAEFEADLREIENKAEMDVAKQRHGPTGRVYLGWKGETTQFFDWSNER